jgi:hypothetical protein
MLPPAFVDRRLAAGACLWAALFVVALRAEDQAAPKQPAALQAAAEQVVDVRVDPPKVELVGPAAQFSLLIEGRLPDGRWIDLTRAAKLESNAPQVVQTGGAALLIARGDGRAAVSVDVAGKRLLVDVTVAGTAEPRRINFENDVVPLLSRFGCNSSGCHGKAEGQNGFKLSVFGFDPRADYEALTKEGRGRRVFPAAPDRSLLLGKAGGEMPHGGGVRIRPESREYATLREWIAAGLPFGEASDPKVESISLSPRERILAFGGEQQLRVVARYTDGRTVDVTSLARFQSNNEGLVVVDEAGLVTAGQSPGQAAVMASFMGAVDVFQAVVPRAERIEPYPQTPTHNFIDEHVYAKLRKLNIAPSPQASDAEFLRRAYLDIIGTLPTTDEAREFLADTRPDRRARLVDDLLARPEYADFWALWWSDLLRVDRQALGHKGAYAYYRWIRDSLAANKPLDQMAREIVLAEGPLAEVAPAQFYQASKKPGDAASTLSQIFLGVRIACAECHHHPFDRWSQTDYYGMTAYFAPLARKKSPRGEVLLANGEAAANHPRTGERIFAHALGTNMPAEKPQPGDRRGELADWLTSPENPWFARNLANRLWAHFLGRGLVEPVDDVRATNPPTNPELLDALAARLIEARFDMRELIGAIAVSAAYQRSSQTNPTNERDEQNYSRALFKRMPAEVLFDAVCQTTGVDEKFDGLPAGYRAIQLWDSQAPHYFLRLFGRPQRQTACECERNTQASVAQVLHLMNSPEINSKLSHDAGRVARLAREIDADDKLVEELYLTFYSRFPTESERAKGVEHLRSSPAGRRAAAEDLAWSLLNSLEFVFNR